MAPRSRIRGRKQRSAWTGRIWGRSRLRLHACVKARSVLGSHWLCPHRHAYFSWAAEGRSGPPLCSMTVSRVRLALLRAGSRHLLSALAIAVRAGSVQRDTWPRTGRRRQTDVLVPPAQNDGQVKGHTWLGGSEPAWQQLEKSPSAAVCECVCVCVMEDVWL